MENNTEARAFQAASSLQRGFTSAIGAIFATIGSAIGLGNIWKFPYLTGANGGSAFIILYIVCTILVGLPVMIAEIMLGRKARANPIQAMRQLSPSRKQPWWIIGAMGAVSAYLIMAFYSEVAGWVFAYVFKGAFGQVLSTNPDVTTEAFNNLVTNPIQSLAWQWLVLIFVGVILTRGVTKGIEAVTKRLIPLLFVLLLIVDIRSLTLPGSIEGVKYLFSPDFSRITIGAILTALGLAFFKLSLGMGTMITYGSYWQDNQNIPQNTARVMFSDLLASLLAGIAIFPAVFAFGFEPAAGPSLLFITIPAVFASMPLGNIFLVVFFILAAVAATGAMLSLVEVPVAFLNEQFKLSRVKATWITVITLAMIGSTAALSSSLLADTKVFGLTFFDLFDFTSSNILLPLGGLLIAIFTGWIWGVPKIIQALSNNQTLQNSTVIKIFIILIRYVAPFLILIILLQGLNLIKF